LQKNEFFDKLDAFFQRVLVILLLEPEKIVFSNQPKDTYAVFMDAPEVNLMSGRRQPLLEELLSSLCVAHAGHAQTSDYSANFLACW